MKLRLKFILIFATLITVAIIGLVYYANLYFGDYFKNRTLDNFQLLAETSESAYFAFIKGLEIRTVDWSSDGHIRGAVEEIIKTPIQDRKPLVKALNGYLRNEKIIFDPTVLILDVLDKDGVVLASSRDERVGVDEKKEELELGNVKFIKAIQANFGEAFVAPVIIEADEHTAPMIHVTTRIFAKIISSTGAPIPLDAVLLLHFVNIDQLGDVLIGRNEPKEERMTGSAFTNHYKTADIYLVNKDRLMITPSRFDQEAVLRQKVDTNPVKACLERGKEIKAEYFDYRGKSVIGASVCLKRDDAVLVVEVESQEILAPLKDISQFLFLGGGVLLIIILAGTVLLSDWLLKGLSKIAGVAENIAKGNLKERVKINSKDEIGFLAKTFNGMLDNIEKSEQGLKEAEIHLQNVNASLESRVKERTAELMGLKAGLEKTVADKTFELQKRLDELEKFKSLTVGRELKMIELKKEIEALQSKKSN